MKHIANNYRPRTLLPNFTRYAIGIQYFGPSFSGWTSNSASRPSIPQVLSSALQKFVGSENFSNLLTSSRTDSGVHALRNVCQVDLVHRLQRKTRTQTACGVEPSCDMLSSDAIFPMDVVENDLDSPPQAAHSEQRVLNALNFYLRDQRIFVTDVRVQDERFDARGFATGRTYMYRIVAPSTRPSSPGASSGAKPRMYRNLFQESSAWIMSAPLDVNAMQKAADSLLGIHDFKPFQGQACESSSTFREVFSVRVSSSQTVGAESLLHLVVTSTSLRFTSLHFTSLHFTSLHFTYLSSPQLTPLVTCCFFCYRY